VGRLRSALTSSRPLAPRIPDVDGVRLGGLDDTKGNANRLLRKTVVGRPGPAHKSRS
jgi:hypothetical protein